MRFGFTVAVAVVCAVGVWVNVRLVWGAGKRGMDFNQFYAASRLAGTGHLYDWDALKTIEAPNGPPIHSGRLPVVSYGVKAISWMPFAPALRVWQGASIAALLLACAVWPGASRAGMLMAVCWSAPAVYLVALGQDVGFWLAACAVGLALLERYPRLAGVAFALCLCKYHLAVGIPVMLAAQKRWKALAAGAAATGALVAASFAIEGWGWPLAYMKTLAGDDFSPGARSMPNLHGLVSWLGGAAGVAEMVGAMAVLALLWMACRKVPSVGMAGALAAGCGVILGHHGYLQDTALLIPLAVMVVASEEWPLWMRGWGVVVLTPVAMVLLMGQAPVAGQVVVVGFVVLAGLKWPCVGTSADAARRSACATHAAVEVEA